MRLMLMHREKNLFFSKEKCWKYTR